MNYLKYRIPFFVSLIITLVITYTFAYIYNNIDSICLQQYWWFGTTVFILVLGWVAALTSTIINIGDLF